MPETKLARSCIYVNRIIIARLYEYCPGFPVSVYADAVVRLIGNARFMVNWTNSFRLVIRPVTG